jgi:DNA polymerase
VQLQNLPRGKINTDEMIADVMRHGYPAIELLYPGKIMDNLSACIRGVFVPAAGHEMLVVDYSAIEARVLMWLANETKGLKEFQISDRGEDEDIYVKMAQRIYEDKTLTKKKNPDKRMLGKQTILGAGYGMGHVKFQATCAGYGIILSEEEASRIINLYRSTYFNIKNYWYDTERAVLEAFNTPDKTIVQGRISWEYDTKRNIIRCSLPSGRILTYHRPKIAENKFGGKSLSFMTEVTSQWVRRDVYGGMLVENVTQAVARDIMAYSISGLEYAGFPVLMHTHDEIVSQQPIGENRLQEMKNIMCAISIWAHGCPIEAEGFVCTRYKKG